VRVRLTEVPFLEMCEVRGPVVPSIEFGQVLELGPAWWLIVEGEAPGVPAGSAVDVSAQRTVLELSGPEAHDILMTGCPIDLHPTVFEAGQHAQTLLGQAQVILQRGDDTTFRIFVRSSFASYLAEWLLDAMVGA
jgi:sarcosine oxidase subunit alpha